MMRSLFSGVSGLKNHQTRMDVIGNNISNVNTTGFKSSRATFSDLFSQTLTGASAPQGNTGGTNAKQIGLGSSVSSVDLLFTNGSVNSTGVNTDLALSSENALFILDNGGGKVYTRNGDFQFDADGNYVQAGNGYYVQGWMANDGAIDTGASVTKITIPSGKSMPPAASTRAAYTNNLNAEVPTITKVMQGGTDKTASGATASATEPVTITLSDGSTMQMTSGFYQEKRSLPIVTTLSVYDSLGSVHDVSVYFTLTSAADDKWEVALSNAKGYEQTINEPDGSTTTVSIGAVKELKFQSTGAYDSGDGTLTLTLTNGSASGQEVTLDLSGLTQYSSGSTISGKADGNAAGTLASVSIDRTGTITGTYTNGEKQIEAQVALQRFTNPGGLTKIGDSLYEESNNSGKSGEPNTAEAIGAKLTPAALELSNVDVANEFTDMIVTQRGFQSNSKVITVSDEMLETIVNMKR
ncbi:MAG: flagellar hook protein FlgE [Schwartzia sp.]|nr:flagellar hook protein FlgE [Schwartzia sp. (in: firmicutes)]